MSGLQADQLQSGVEGAQELIKKLNDTVNQPGSKQIVKVVYVTYTGHGDGCSLRVNVIEDKWKGTGFGRGSRTGGVGPMNGHYHGPGLLLLDDGIEWDDFTTQIEQFTASLVYKREGVVANWVPGFISLYKANPKDVRDTIGTIFQMVEDTSAVLGYESGSFHQETVPPENLNGGLELGTKIDGLVSTLGPVKLQEEVYIHYSGAGHWCGLSMSVKKDGWEGAGGGHGLSLGHGTLEGDYTLHLKYNYETFKERVADFGIDVATVKQQGALTIKHPVAIVFRTADNEDIGWIRPVLVSEAPSGGASGAFKHVSTPNNEGGLKLVQELEAQQGQWGGRGVGPVLMHQSVVINYTGAGHWFRLTMTVDMDAWKGDGFGHGIGMGTGAVEKSCNLWLKWGVSYDDFKSRVGRVAVDVATVKKEGPLTRKEPVYILFRTADDKDVLGWVTPVHTSEATSGGGNADFTPE